MGSPEEADAGRAGGGAGARLRSSAASGRPGLACLLASAVLRHGPPREGHALGRGAALLGRRRPREGGGWGLPPAARPGGRRGLRPDGGAGVPERSQRGRGGPRRGAQAGSGRQPGSELWCFGRRTGGSVVEMMVAGPLRSRSPFPALAAAGRAACGLQRRCSRRSDRFGR